MTEEPEYILNKLRSYCAAQERCISEIEKKLDQWKVKHDQTEKIIEQLIRENYLNEERFARSFARGKFRINHWGKTKIIYELEKRKIPDSIIQKGLEEIEEEEYEKNLREILDRKSREIKEPDPLKRRQKLIAYGLQKGFHYGLIKEVFKQMEI